MHGATGPLSSNKRKTPQCSATEIGCGGTVSWKLPALHGTSAVALFFEVPEKPQQSLPEGTWLPLQFQTQYQHSSGQMRLRVRPAAFGEMLYKCLDHMAP